MSALVAAIAKKIPPACQVARCNKDRCQVDLHSAPSPWVLVDMDHPELPGVGEGNRGDYVFIGGDGDRSWVALLELKSGRFSVGHVLEQLRGTASIVASWLPQAASFQLAPILAHKRPIHALDVKRLRAQRIDLRGRQKGVELIRCGGKLTDGLKAVTPSRGTKSSRRKRGRKSK